ncbi:hypothetical protein [Streptomyces sp. NPDC006739]|uniref:hypothetical protein n=1 Tax=Streptomyces sp. NPDC006739 TaxID=3364763 RepID=UPI0036B0CFBF
MLVAVLGLALFTGLCMWVAAWISDGVSFSGGTGHQILTALLVAVIYVVLMALASPVAVVSEPFWVTAGLSLLVFWLTYRLSHWWGLGFHVHGFEAVVIGTLAVSPVTLIVLSLTAIGLKGIGWWSTDGRSRTGPRRPASALVEFVRLMVVATVLCLWVAAWISDGISLSGGTGHQILTSVQVAAIYALLMASVALVAWLPNSLMTAIAVTTASSLPVFWLTYWVSQWWGLDFHVHGFLSVLVGTLAVSPAAFTVSMLTGLELSLIGWVDPDDWDVD